MGHPTKDPLEFGVSGRPYTDHFTDQLHASWITRDFARVGD